MILKKNVNVGFATTWLSRKGVLYIELEKED
jgi:hypothetical protein